MLVQRTGAGTGPVNTGTLPSSVGTDPSKPPAMSCYIAAFQTGPWVAVNDGWSATTPYCYLVFQNGGWVAVMEQVPTLDWAAFVIVY